MVENSPLSGCSSLRLTIETIADAAVARALVMRTGLMCGLDQRRAAELALASSELVTNIVKYANGGELLVECEPESLVVTALDRGPGPPSEDELFSDGFSRGALRLPDHSIATGRGTGGGALRRLCDRVELHPRDGGGSMIRCYKHRAR
jgi:anti-sigma regulatory factor (Ser/Thr protein kinase)